MLAVVITIIIWGLIVASVAFCFLSININTDYEI